MTDRWRRRQQLIQKHPLDQYQIFWLKMKLEFNRGKVRGKGRTIWPIHYQNDDSDPRASMTNRVTQVITGLDFLPLSPSLSIPLFCLLRQRANFMTDEENLVASHVVSCEHKIAHRKLCSWVQSSLLGGQKWLR